VNTDVTIIVACTAAGTLVGTVRCLRAVSAGGFRTTSPVRYIFRGIAIGLVIGLLASELRTLF
jgi:hypothetical protein